MLNRLWCGRTEPLSHSSCYILKLHGDYKDARILNTDEELGGYGIGAGGGRSNLSGDQRLHIAIARALVTKPRPAP